MVNQSNYRTRLYHLTVEEYDKLNDKHITHLDINNYLKDEIRVQYYAFILHDHDKNVSGDDERKHYHLHLYLVQPYAKNTIIKAIASALLINDACIQARKVRDDVKSVQYLIHRNDKEKYQYDYLDIWTNDVNELNLNLYSNSSSYELDINYLIELVKKCGSLSEIYQNLGLDKSKRYRALICDMFREEHIERYL